MKYPNNIKKNYAKMDNHANRGMDLEQIINDTNEYYINNDIAHIYKKPTPIGVVRVDFNNNNRITDAYFKEPSTLDYNGIYHGYYIEFDAKVTQNKTSFPLNNIHKHQLLHIKNIDKHNGIVFLIILINEKFYLLPGKTLINFINNNTRKSIPYEYIVNNAYEIQYNYLKGVDYLKIIDKLIGVDNNAKN